MKSSLTLLLSLSGLACAAAVTSRAHPHPHVRAAQQHQHQQRALQNCLFPTFHTYTAGFTTAAGISVAGVSTVALSDAALNVVNVQAGMTHDVVAVAQGGKTAWEASYPAGSWNPSNTPLGGFGFYLGGSDEFARALAAGATEVMFAYSVMFEDGFEFNKGGKLPGAFGGNGDQAYGCSGGRQTARSECFDGRLMWRASGLGELYTYLPLTPSNTAAQLSVPGSLANADYGFSVGRGAFAFPAGAWVAVAQRVRLNTPGAADGQIKLWIDGAEAVALYNVSLREHAGATIQGMQFQTFFGGSTSDWASPKDQKAWFADVSGAVIVS